MNENGVIRAIKKLDLEMKYLWIITGILFVRPACNKDIYFFNLE